MFLVPVCDSSGQAVRHALGLFSIPGIDFTGPPLESYFILGWSGRKQINNKSEYAFGMFIFFLKLLLINILFQ